MPHFFRAEGKRPFCGTHARRRVFIVLAALLAASAAVQAASTLSSLSGTAFVLKAGAPVWEPAFKGQSLAPQDQVRTGSRSRATVSFEDGSRIELGPNGSFTLQEAKKDSSALKLSLGSLRAWVSKALSKHFEVRTPTAVCAVRGTEFAVEVGAQGNTRVEMFAGLLSVADRAGNEILLKENQRIEVTDRGLGPVSGAGTSRDAGASDKSREAMKREVGLEMSKEEVQAAAALEAKNAVYQQGKAIIDVNGNRVRIEEYIIRPQPDQFKLVVLNERTNRFDYFYYKGIFNKVLPDDLSTALRQLPGCINSPCNYFLTGYETARSNTQDNMLEITSGGHQVDVNNNGYAADAVTAAFDPATDQFVTLAANQPFYKTLFDNYRLTFNGVEHSKWAPFGASNITKTQANVAGGVAYTYTTQLVYPPTCGPPNCTYDEAGIMHSVVYAENGDGSIWERYDNYIISDEGKIANTVDFAGFSSGTSYKQTLLKWNYQTIVTASEFNGRKIDLAVEPKIFIQSGLIP